jgi:hypothetical protein
MLLHLSFCVSGLFPKIQKKNSKSFENGFGKLKKIKQKGFPHSSWVFGLLAQLLDLISPMPLPSSLSVRPARSPLHRADGPTRAGAQLLSLLQSRPPSLLLGRPSN